MLAEKLLQTAKSLQKPFNKPNGVSQSFNKFKKSSGGGKSFSSSRKLIVKVQTLQESEKCRAVMTSGFSTDVIKCFRSMPNFKYNPTTKYWTFSLSDMDNLLEGLKQVPGAEVDHVDG